MPKQVEFDALETFLKDFSNAKNSYKQNGDATALLHTIQDIALHYKDYFGIGDLILSYAEELIVKGDRSTGYAIVQILNRAGSIIANLTLFYIRLAEIEFDSGNTEAGKQYLITLCQKIDNIEESIKLNDLSEVWEEYKHFVADEISMVSQDAPCSPEDCSMAIADIIKLPQDEFLSALSKHLAELSGNGARLDLLSEQERNIYLIDEFVSTLNADGLENYFSYCEDHFPLLFDAFSAVGCVEAVDLWRIIENKLLQLHISEQNFDFDKEEHIYYTKVEKKLLRNMYSYVRENAKDFR